MFYAFASTGVRLLLRLLTRCRVEGLENVPGTGPLLLAANHLNLVDPPVLGALLPRRITFMAKQELFGVPVVGWMVKWYGAFPVRRGQADRQALRTAVAALGRGQVVGMFPEGTRSRTGRMQEAHAGAALVALMSEAPVLPVSITGTDRLRSLLRLRRPAVVVRVGRPFTLGRRTGRADLESSTRTMMARVATLLPEDRRGHYAEAAAELCGAAAWESGVPSDSEEGS
jgi:1-acyl-sn-glycerol-3-phosphate acyltransferase